MHRQTDNTKFSFKAFRGLKKRLGEFDATVECNELAILEFLENIKSSVNSQKSIQELSKKHKVSVDNINIQLFSARIRLFYILSVMQQAEQFIDEFRKEYKIYYPTWKDKIDGETDFDNLLANIFSSKKQGITEIGEDIYYGFEYYRLVRNRFAHSEEKSLTKLDNLFNDVIKYSDVYNTKFHILEAPNDYENIGFNDFLLCTNIIKNIGYIFCQKCKPDNSVLARIIKELEIHKGSKVIKPLKKINKLKNNPKRFLNAFNNLLNTTFGKINDEDRNEIFQQLK